MGGLRHNKGQTTLPEYVVTFFLVIGVIVAMTIYIQRALQARVWDARNYAVNVANQACDADCHAAAGVANKSLPYEYEPYYGYVNSTTTRSSNTTDALLAVGETGIFRKIINEENQSSTYSEQLPPKAAVGSR